MYLNSGEMSISPVAFPDGVVLVLMQGSYELARSIPPTRDNSGSRPAETCGRGRCADGHGASIPVVPTYNPPWPAKYDAIIIGAAITD